MTNQNNDPKKIMLGLLLGVAVGATALHFYSSSHQSHQPSVLNKMGQTLREIGEMLENSDSGSYKSAFSEAHKNTSKGSDILHNLYSWFSNGMHLWKKLAKGD